MGRNQKEELSVELLMLYRKSFVLLVLFLLTSVGNAFSQCAMCRATIENNLSNGDVGIGAGLNFGILYLFVMPYLAISVVGFFWYKHSKANARKKNVRHYSRG